MMLNANKSFTVTAIIVEIATLTREKNKTKVSILDKPEVNSLIEEHNRLEKEEEARKKREAEANQQQS